MNFSEFSWKSSGLTPTLSDFPAKTNLGDLMGFFLFSKSSIFAVKFLISTQMVFVTSDQSVSWTNFMSGSSESFLLAMVGVLMSRARGETTDLTEINLNEIEIDWSWSVMGRGLGDGTCWTGLEAEVERWRC